MKRILAAAAIAIALAGCSLFHHHRPKTSNPYENPFYAQFLNTGSRLDAQIKATLAELQKNPHNPALHNALGQMLMQKGFPNDAAHEFETAINEDGHFYQAWYNLGLVRSGMGDYSGAARAFSKTVSIMKGHSEALFQLGRIEEIRGNTDAAVAYYAKAIRHNPRIVDVRYNPQILDSKLIGLALLQNYEILHTREAGRTLDTPPDYIAPQPPKQPDTWPVPAPQQIVTPAPPPTSPAQQPAPPPKTTT